MSFLCIINSLLDIFTIIIFPSFISSLQLPGSRKFDEATSQLSIELSTALKKSSEVLRIEYTSEMEQTSNLMLSKSIFKFDDIGMCNIILTKYYTSHIVFAYMLLFLSYENSITYRNIIQEDDKRTKR